MSVAITEMIGDFFLRHSDAKPSPLFCRCWCWPLLVLLQCENVFKTEHVIRKSFFFSYKYMISMTNTKLILLIFMRKKLWWKRIWRGPPKKIEPQIFVWKLFGKVFFDSLDFARNMKLNIITQGKPYYNLGVRMRSDIKLLLHRWLSR